MDGNTIALGMLWFVAFLFSATCHEAAHSWAAHRGGDPTAHAAGQVSLDPMPHIRREPIGLIVIPWVSYFLAGWMMGWASAPYNPNWARQYPRRAAWMALAGPAANFGLVALAAVLMHVGIGAGWFELSGRVVFSELVEGSGGSAAEGAATLLSILFSLNLLLGAFNLLPVPPLDGYSVLGIFLPEQATLKLMDLRYSMQGMALIGVLVAWRLFDYVFEPVFVNGLRLLYFPYR